MAQIPILAAIRANHRSCPQHLARSALDPWLWRCEHCGCLSNYYSLPILEERIRVRTRVPRTDHPIAHCDHCGQGAHWMHIASEIQVNRALRAPNEYLLKHHTNEFRRLQSRDHSHELRLLDPAETLHAAATEWSRTQCSLDRRKRLLHQIRDIFKAGSSGVLRYWSNVRMHS